MVPLQYPSIATYPTSTHQLDAHDHQKIKKHSVLLCMECHCICVQPIVIPRIFVDICDVRDVQFSRVDLTFTMNTCIEISYT